MQLERERPVQKVIGILNDMKANLEAEAKADEEMYEKMTCYCDSTKAEKTKAIADAEVRCRVAPVRSIHGAQSLSFEKTRCPSP